MTRGGSKVALSQRMVVRSRLAVDAQIAFNRISFLRLANSLTSKQCGYLQSRYPTALRAPARLTNPSRSDARPKRRPDARSKSCVPDNSEAKTLPQARNACVQALSEGARQVR